MARFYSNENFPMPVVQELRRNGHDVLTSFEAGNANQRVPDEEVLSFATKENRALLTLNRKHFIRLHKRDAAHAGIVACTADADYTGQARRIHTEVEARDSLLGQLVRINRPC